MGRSILRQETQIRKSDVYDDTIAASLANYETSATDLQYDLNVLRSLGHLLLKNSAGNWYDGLNVPSTLDTGSARGVNDLNTDLHELERKRLLFRVQLIADIVVPSSAAATGTLTASANMSNGETVTIDAKVYTFETTLTNVDGNIQIGATLADSLQNFHDAINLTGTPGTQYALAMTLHPTVTCTASDATTLTVAAKSAGTGGNSIATTETGANMSWGAATLSGGAGDVVILGSGEIPSTTTAAVGVVTTEGVVVAYEANFGTATLTEVVGINATRPKNLLLVHDENGDPILSGGQTVYGLFQYESNTDGSTITITTPNRVQISFVRENGTNDDLELVPAADIGGLTIHYAYTERKALDDLPETAFLPESFVDGAVSADVTRQNAYDNQSTAPVLVTTNSILELDAASIYWKIRDNAGADLLTITEGSAGGTTVYAIGSDVDTYDNNAVVNDFAAGITVDSGGTAINVGVTTGSIDAAGLTVEATGANPLNLLAGTDISIDSSGGEIKLDDVNQDGSTWTQTFIKLSETSAEWNTFKANFGETSLIDAINQAYTAVGARRRVFAVATSDVNADNDVSGPSDDNNIDTDLGDLSSGTFVDDYDFYINGQYLRPGADAAANHDVYPGTSLANGQLRFEFKIKIGDQLCIVDYI